MNVTQVIIRPSPAVAIGKLLGVMILLFLCYGIFILGTDYVDMARSSPFFQVIELDTLAFIVLAVLIIGATIILQIHWAFETYEIYAGEIMHHKGVVFVREERHSLDNVETITYDQSLFGRLFKYGTIRLHSPLLKTEISIPHIPDPARQTLLIRSAVGHTHEKIVPLEV